MCDTSIEGVGVGMVVGSEEVGVTLGEVVGMLVGIPVVGVSDGQ